jgi:uncharacterized repeat protein (TIGR03803 family)
LLAAALSTLASFGYPSGGFPIAGLVEDSSGDFFGTTRSGGSSGIGTVFEVRAGTGAVTTLASFNGANGAGPFDAGVVEDSNGDLFGTTAYGGSGWNGSQYSGDGTVFELKAGSSAVTTLACFNGTNGATPYAGLVQDGNGNLFGTTSAGGASGSGTVFEVKAGSNAVTTIASFNGENGESPWGGLIEDSSGDLFGTTFEGGVNGEGTLFEINAGSSAVTTLASFNQTDGEYPMGNLVEDTSGDLFGTTTEGGAGNEGAVFELKAGSSIITTLASFDDSNGEFPYAGLVEDSSGNLFGTTRNGGPSGPQGTVFEVRAGSNVITTLASFNGTNGQDPEAGLVEDSSGNLFGTTMSGGSGYQNGLQSGGTVFEIKAGSNTVTTVASFGDNGFNPDVGLIEDSSGNLFGTTCFGGPSGYGTVFEIKAGSDAISTIASFNGTDGAEPESRLVEDSSGDLFGTTYAGGSSSDGTVFEVKAGSNTVTTIASFNGANGAFPEAGLVEDSSGNLFGTTCRGGAANNYGTVFEIKAGNNTVTVLASSSLPGQIGSASVGGGLMEDSSGDLFGTTQSGGSSGYGTVYEIKAGSNTVTVVASFGYTNGALPEGDLIEDSSGDLFGTTYEGGSGSDGTVFEIKAGTGAVTALASFNGANGAGARAGLIEDSSGDLFGTTYGGGSNTDGTAFEIKNGSNAITTLVSFNGTNGANPDARLVEDSSGNLFGTTANGGSTNNGTVFEVFTGAVSTTTVISSPTPVTYGTPVTLTATVSAPPGIGAPAGSVDFYDTTTKTDLGQGVFTGSTDGTSTWTFTTGAKTLNATAGDTITATYAPGTGFAGSSGTTTEVVTAIPLTVSGITAADKVYNGNTLATLNTTGAALAGVLSGDVVTLGTSGASGTFASKNVGQNVAVSVSGLTLSGTQAGDYTLTQPTTTANITPATLTVSGITAANKVYNANLVATLNTTGAALVGVLSGDTVTLGTSGTSGTFASKNVGQNIAVSVSGLTLSGAQASDYTLTQPTAAANITPAALTVSGITAADKTYDGTTTAMLQGLAAASLVGVYSGDSVTLGTSAAVGAFASRNVGQNVTVSVTGLTLSGAQAGDYLLTQPTASANVTPRAITVTAATNTKVYDGTTFATAAPTITSGSPATGDTAAFGESYNSAAVGTGKTLTPGGSVNDGNGGANYAVTTITNTTGQITPLPITVTAASSTKTYDGTTSSTATPMIAGGMTDVVTTLAGSAGQIGSSDGTGSAAWFDDPWDVAVDSAGDVYVADTENQEIRKITPSGIVTTLAGSAGQSGSSDGTGSAARFAVPQGLAVDSAGNVYVADTDNCEIRKITPSGVVTTLAGSARQTGSSDGTGSAARFDYPEGVAVDSAGNVYVADTDNQEIRKITPSGVVTTLAGGQWGSSNGTGSAARFDGPAGVAVDSAGNVYVADWGNDEIRKVTPFGIVTTLAGSAGQSGSSDGTGSAARLDYPSGVAMDIAGNIFIADEWNHEVREITPSGVVTTLAGSAGQIGSNNGIGSAARFDYPWGVAVDSAGNVYVADTGNDEIRKISSAGLVSGDSPAFSETFDTRNVGTGKTLTPAGSVNDGDGGNNYTLSFVSNTAGSILPLPITVTAATSTKTYDGTASATATPTITGGSLASGDTAAFTEAFSNKNAGSAKTLAPGGSVNDGNGGSDYSVTFVNSTAGSITAGAITVTASAATKAYDGTTSSTITPTITGGSLATGDTAAFTETFSTKNAGTGETLTPTGTVNDGNSGANYAVSFVTNTTGQITPLPITVTAVTSTKAYDGTICSTATPTIISGYLVTTLAGSVGLQGSSDGTGGTAAFCNPESVAVDSAGNVYVADESNDEIRKITPSGVVTTLAGSAGQVGSSNGTGSAARFDDPEGVAVDSAGNVYVADNQNDEIRKITPSGVVTTLSGSAGQRGSSNGTGSAARFYDPSGVAVDSAGNVYVADWGNDEIREITSSGVVTTLAGSAGQTGSSDGTGSAARFNLPQAVAVDSEGNVYVADEWNFEIRKISPSDVVTTLAGSVGQSGSSNGTGSAARFYYPSGVAVDSEGNVYVADYDNQEIRNITPAGVVSTLAGSARQPGSSNGISRAARFCSPAGVAVDSEGNVYVADQGNDEARAISPAGLVSGDMAAFTETYNTKNAGTGLTLTLSGSVNDSNGGNNYAVTFVNNTAGAINQAGLTITAVTNTKTYDGTTSAVATPTVAGLVGGDTVTGLSETYNNKNAGSGKTLTVAAYVLNDGNGGGNYAVTTAANTAGHIRPLAITVTAASSTKTYDGTTASTAIPTITGGSIAAGDTAAFTEQYVSAGAGAGLTLVPVGSVNDGNGGNNYLVTWADNFQGVIYGPTPAYAPLAGGALSPPSGTGAPTVSTFAGPGPISQPDALACDAAGNLYVIGEHSTIFKVTPAGTISTFVSSGLDWPDALAFDAAGNLYVANGGNSTISEVTPAGAVSTFVSSGLDDPTGLAFDAAGNLYVANWVTATIFKVTPAGAVSTFASGLIAPSALAFHGGYIYVANQNANTISKVTSAGVVSTFVSSGLDKPEGLAFDAAGYLYVANDGNSTISEVWVGGVSTFVSSGIFYPDALAFDAAGNLYVANSNNTVSKVTSAGAVSTFVDGLFRPENLAFDTAGNLYVSSEYSSTISKVAPAGALSPFVSGLDEPGGLAFDAAGSLYAADCDGSFGTNGTISRVTPSGAVSTFAYSGLNWPDALAFDDAGNLYVTNEGTNPVSKVTSTGVVSTFVSSGLNEPEGLAFDAAGYLYVANLFNNTISKVTPAGTVSTFASGGLDEPCGLVFDAAGNLYVANDGNDTISKVTPSGTVSTFVSSGLDEPCGLAFDAAGNLYVTNWNGNTISRIAPPVLVEGMPFSGTVFRFTDSDPQAAPSDYTAVVTLGDGNSVTLSSSGVVSGPAGAGGQIVADPNGGFDVQLSYTYAETLSNQTFAVKVTDLNGASISASDSSFNVVAVQTATTVSASQASVTYGTPVTFMATVAAQTGTTAPTAGSVDFYDTTTGTDLGLGTFSDSTGVTSTWTLTTGAKTFNVTAGDTITATYSPGTGFAGSSGTATVVVTPLGISGNITASNKVYDGTTAATISSYNLTGVLGGDAVSLTGGTASFASPSAANGITVTATGLSLTGAQAGDYSLSNPTETATANITPLSISGSVTASNKAYDGGTTATIASRTLTGVLGSDAVSLTGGTATFASPSAANGLTVTATGLSLTGAQAGDYSLSNPTETATANITPLGTSGSITVSSKIYDGTTAATISGYSLTGVLGGDSVSLAGGTAAYPGKNVGTGLTVTVTGLGLTGAQASDYSLLNPTETATAAITARPITVTAISATKTYDGTTSSTATPTVTGGSLAARDTALFTETYNTAAVGTGKTLMPAGSVNDGNGGNNYAVTLVNNSSGTINPLASTVNLTWSGPGNALTLTDSASGGTPAVVISEPTAGVSTLEINLGAGYVFAAGSTASATGLAYQNAGSPTTSQYATVDISSAGNVSSLVATLPGDYLTLGPIRDVAGGIGSITASAGTIEVTGISSASVNGSVSLEASGNLTVDAGAGILTGTGTISLAADVNVNGTGNDDVGTLSIGAGAAVASTSSASNAITLRGADINIDTSANPALVGATQRSLSTTPTATLTGLYAPQALAFDASGNLFVANQNYTTVSEFAPGATTPTATLTGLSNPDALVFDSSGDLFVANLSGTVSKFAPGATTPTATLTGVSYPYALAIDSGGNLYVSNQKGTTVSKFAPGATTPTATLTGLNCPFGLAFDSSGNLYVANYGTYGNGSTVSKFTSGATTPTATLTGLRGPVALAFDPSGNLYVGNYTGSWVSKFTAGATTPTTNLTGVNGPYAMAFDPSGNLYVADNGSSAGTTVSKFAPGATTPTATLTGLNNPEALAFDTSGNLFVANWGNGTVSKFAATTIPAAGGVVVRSSLPARPMSIGGTNNAVNGIDLTDAELGQIYTTDGGTVTFGDSSQTGNITFTTATPATTPGTSTVVVQSQSGPGGIILDDTGSGTGLNGNGGSVTLTPGTGGIVTPLNASGVPLATKGFNATGLTLGLSLDFAPSLGTHRTVVNNTATPAASNPITGTFANLPQGGTISATYNGTTYWFQANYAGGDGNDLVLTEIAVPTTTSLSTSQPSVTYGTPVTFTATVTAQLGSAAPTGNVDFYDTTTGHDLGLGSLENSSGTISTWTLTTGAKTFNVTGGDTITTTYTPGGGFVGSSGTTTQTVTARPITVAAVPDDKIYDGTTGAAALPAIISGGLVAGDTAVFSETFDNKNVGIGKTLAVVGSVNDGNGGNNYTVIFLTDTTGAIAPCSITVMATANSKAYDGTTAASAAPAITTGSLGAGDTAAFRETYDTPVVGTGKTLTPSGSVNDGDGGANYSVTFVASTTGAITQTVDRFAVAASPASVTAGSPFLLTVTAEDQSGHIVTGYAGTVDFSSDDPREPLPAGGLSFPAGTGVAATLATLETAGTWTITTADTTNPSIQGVSAAVTVTAAPAAAVVFSQPPKGTSAGTTIPLTVQVVDPYGNLISSGSSSTTNVTLAIFSGPTGAKLLGTTTVQASGGVASFNNVAVDKVGSYSLIASGAGVRGSATSNSFTVTVGPAAQLAFTTQPSNTLGADTLTNVVVAVEDAYGNVVTGDNSSVTLTLNAAASGGGGVLHGTTTATATGGVATFSGLSIVNSANPSYSAAGSGYTLTASDTDAGVALTSGKSTAFNTTFIVTSCTMTPTGFVATFSQPFEVATTPVTVGPNLYSALASNDAPVNVALIGSNEGPERGSLMVNSTDTQITFVATTLVNSMGLPIAGVSSPDATSGVLAPDVYTVVLNSTGTSFVTTNGQLLDGADSGTGGTNFNQATVVDNSADVDVVIPSFARGPSGSLATSVVNVTNASAPIAAAASAGLSESGNTVTVTTTVPDGLVVGDPVTISGAGIDGYNGTFTVTSLPGGASGTTFTYTDSTSGLAASGGGTASLARGIPISLSGPTAGVTSGQFTLTYSASDLTISGALVDPSLAASYGATLSLDAASTPGNAIIDFSTTTPLPSAAGAPILLGGLTATVPSEALYTAKDLLHFSSVSLSTAMGSVAAIGADALHMVVFPGDTTGGDGYISSADRLNMSRVVAGADTGFAAYPLTDPDLLGDLLGDGAVDGPAGALLGRYVNGVTSPQMPVYPGHPVNMPSVAGPAVSAASTLQVGVGSSVMASMTVAETALPTPTGATASVIVGSVPAMSEDAGGVSLHSGASAVPAHVSEHVADGLFAALGSTVDAAELAVLGSGAEQTLREALATQMSAVGSSQANPNSLLWDSEDSSWLEGKYDWLS